ncbi:hypothetical protein HPB49_003947 [Dermacentor silvarum]|uniref:Uncharacterized protein n=1 Tax=Dermacentor silvarum TaxID=543639 RepID=A0ACB8DU46_DERSI|nr:hypothetical protein HPB49_003947 [Dermacentor silvarum]
MLRARLVLRAVFLRAVAHTCFVLSVEEMAGMIINAELLIAAVEQQPALWMASHRQHKDKYVKAALWREVAAAVMPGVGIEAVEAATGQVAHKNRQRSGAGQDDVESGDSTWAFFDLLLFLKDTMQTRV